MQFNSYSYILCFLPAVVVLYFLSSKLHRNAGKIVLIAASALFYTNFNPAAAKVMAISLMVNFACSKCIEHSRDKVQSRNFLAAAVVVNIFLLLYFKYTNFFIENINTMFGKEIALKELVLPLGISFFTFQQIAYVVSVYRGEVGKTGLDYLLYILFFPKILMGPLVEPKDLIPQFNDPALKLFDQENFLQGLQILSFGLFKKVMLADVFAVAVRWGYSNIEAATSMDWILVMLFYTFEIYFDFSGYSDMAVGSALMFNVSLPMNFDSPYRAISVRDFWKRWHISLTKFFTKYIYIPLGGSRLGAARTYLNTFAVFLISGIWHGADWTFIIWGITYGILMILDRVFENAENKIFQPLRWAVTFSIVNLLWLLFRSESIAQWTSIVKKIAFLQDTGISEGLISCFILPESRFISDILKLDYFTGNIRGFWMLVFAAAAFAITLIPENNYRSIKKVTPLTVLVSAVAFAWSVICLGGESVFVYFNF